MTKQLALAAMILLGGGLITSQVANEPGPGPSKVRTVKQTPGTITLQMHVEETERQIKRAANIARMLYLANGCSDTFAELTARNAINQGLPVRLVTAVVIVESTCRPAAVSSEGAVGLMQIAPNWGVSRRLLKDPAFNLKKGTEILAGYTRQHGLREGLHHYNGLGVGCAACDEDYPDKVLLVAGLTK